MRTDLVSTEAAPIPQVLSIGFSDDPMVTKYGPSRRNQYIIHYVLSGKGRFNGETVRAGQGFLITPGTEEEYFPDEKDPWCLLWIISEDESMAYYFDRHGGDKRSGIFEFHNRYVLENTMQTIRESGTSLVSSPFLAEIFLRIFNSSVVTDLRVGGGGSRVYLDFAIGFIKANVRLPITVTEICKTVGVSQPYLYKLFKEALGVSPKRYITDCKISEAKRLLTETELNVTEVAAAVGFVNSLDFSKFFAKNVGTAPTDYRAQVCAGK